jgi:hypothetical protein
MSAKAQGQIQGQILEGLLRQVDGAGPDEAADTQSVIKRALHAIRAHLGMEVAYISEFVGEQSVFREVDAPGLEHVIKAGDSRSLDDD